MKPTRLLAATALALAAAPLLAATTGGISPQRLSAQGYADTRPAAALQGDSAAAHARARSENRRVVIRVY